MRQDLAELLPWWLWLLDAPLGPAPLLPCPFVPSLGPARAVSVQPLQPGGQNQRHECRRCSWKPPAPWVRSVCGGVCRQLPACTSPGCRSTFTPAAVTNNTSSSERKKLARKSYFSLRSPRLFSRAFGNGWRSPAAPLQKLLFVQISHQNRQKSLVSTPD